MNKKSLLIVLVITIIILISSAKIKPFNDSPTNHLEELKQIPEVAEFYKKYGNYNIIIVPDGAYTYQIDFQAKNEEQWIMLKIRYLYGIPSSSMIICTPDGIESQYRITDDALKYLKEQHCFVN